ncbi:MAG: hypothetical protein KDD61_09855 [Bdellovibrionales bacterium]|nr:hypothetical protein [Bdellovibrionales bacterium]
MEESDFEGTLVLEKLSELGQLESFLDAVDSDDFEQAKSLMRQADVDLTTIKIVIRKMQQADE